MMKSGWLIFLLIAAVMTTPVQAHEGHGDQIGLDEAIEVGKIQIKRLVDEHLIAGSWENSHEFNYDKSDMMTIAGKKRWVVAFDNASEIDPAKKAIKIFMTPLGKFISYEFVNQ